MSIACFFLLALSFVCGVLCCLFNKKKPWPFFFASVLYSIRRLFWLGFKGHRSLSRFWPTFFEAENGLVQLRYVFLFEIFDLWNIVEGCRSSLAEKTSDNQRILCVNLAHVGDMLHTVPMLRSLRTQHPNARIEVLCGPWCRSVVERIQYIDKWHTYSTAAMVYHRGYTDEVESLPSEFKRLCKLRRNAYDMIICASNPQYIERMLCHALRPRIWFSAQNYSNLYARFSQEVCAPYRSRQYEAERISDLITLVGMERGALDLEFNMSEGEERQAKALLDRHNLEEGLYIVLSPGAGWGGKRWPSENYKTLINSLLDNNLVGRIVITGSRSEYELCSSITQVRPSEVVNLCGKTSWGILAVIYREALLWIGNDSGPLHLASAVGCSTLSLFGPTHPEKWAPKGERHRYLQGSRCGADCRPWHIHYICDYDNECMRRISCQRVYEAVVAMVNQDMIQESKC